MKPKAYVTRVLPKPAMDLIHSSCDAEVWDGDLPPPRAVLLDGVRDVEGLLSLVTEAVDGELMNRAAKLRVISNYGVGFDNVDVAEATRRGIIVGNTPGVFQDFDR